MAARLYENAVITVTISDKQGRMMLAGRALPYEMMRSGCGGNEITLNIEMDLITDHNASLLLHHFHAAKQPIGVIPDDHTSMDQKRSEAIMEAIKNASFSDKSIGDFLPMKFEIPPLSETERVVSESLKGLIKRHQLSSAAKVQQDYRDAKNLMFASFYGGSGSQAQAIEDWRKARAAWTSLSAFEGSDTVKTTTGRIRTIAYFDLGDNW